MSKGSPLTQNPSIEAIENFKWSSLREHLQEKCPATAATLQALLPDPQHRKKVVGMKSRKRFVIVDQWDDLTIA